MMIRILLAAMVAVMAALPAQAQESADGNAQVRIIKPLSVVKLADLDFGTIYADGVVSGSITVDPNLPDGSNATVTGSLTTNGLQTAAEFGGAAVRDVVVNIRYPRRDIDIVRVGGTETLTVRDFSIDGSDKRVLAAGEYFTFRIGGTIDIPADVVEGDYEGTIEIFVQYP